jgi:citrate synthase
MTVIPDKIPENFVAGLEGVVAFTTEIAEPDKDGGALRYRGVDIEDLVGRRVTFGDAWALLVDGKFGHGLPPAEPFPLPIHSGDVRVDVQAGLAMLAPIWGYQPLLDIDDATARGQLARASVMARCPTLPNRPVVSTSPQFLSGSLTNAKRSQRVS